MSDQRLSMLSTMGRQVCRDVAVALRRRAELINPLLFFLMVCTLFPLGVGPETGQLATVAPGVLWVVALLACLLAGDGMFRADYDDGSLEQMLVSPASLYLLALAKSIAHWLLTGLPLALLAPLLGLLLQLPAQAIPALSASLLLGTAVLSLIGAVGAALTVGLRRGGLLLALIVLPLYVPVLIFGASAVQAAADGMEYRGLLALALPLSPLAVAAGLRISTDN
jgi:heme exporter protein B